MQHSMIEGRMQTCFRSGGDAIQHQWGQDSSPEEVKQILTEQDFGEQERRSDIDDDSQFPSLTAEEEAERKHDRERRAYIEVEEEEFANELAESFQERVKEKANKRQKQKEKEKREVEYAGQSASEAMVKNMVRKTAKEEVSRAAKSMAKTMARNAMNSVTNAVHHEVMSDVQHELPRQLPDELLRVGNSWRPKKAPKSSSVQHLARTAPRDEVQREDEHVQTRMRDQHAKPLNKDIVPIQHVSKHDRERDHPITHHTSRSTPSDKSRGNSVSDLSKTSREVHEETKHEDVTQRKDVKVKQMMAQISKLQATLKTMPKSNIRSSSDSKNSNAAEKTDKAKADAISPHASQDDLIMESDRKTVVKMNPTSKREHSAAVKNSRVMPPLPKAIEDMPPVHQKLVASRKVQGKPTEKQPKVEGDMDDSDPDPEGDADAEETAEMSNSSEITLLTYGLWIFVGALIVGLMSTIVYCACQGPRDRPWGMPRKRQY